MEFHCELDDFTGDTPLNRILKGASRRIASSESLEWSLRRRARRLADRMDEVSDVRPADLWAAIERRTGHYGDAIALARHVLVARGRLIEHGDAPGFTFLIPTPIMVEEGLRRLLREGLGPHTDVRKSKIAARGAEITFNPDLVFDHGLAVADVKYRLSADLGRSDINQIVTFATSFGSRHSAVLAFWPPGTTARAEFFVGDVALRQLGWLADPALEPEDSGRRLVANVAAWMDSLRPN